MRRAEDYNAAHLLNPVSLADIAQAPGVSVRTQLRGFRSRHGTNPISYLQQLRFECAQHELLAADPACQTVANIAVKYGFHDLGRFAKFYREAFGELPSTILRK